MSRDSARLLGMWRLVSFYLEDSQTRQRHHPYGDHPPGFVTFHEDGRMLAVITPAGRKAPVTEQERAAAFGLLIAYSGRWRLEAARPVDHGGRCRLVRALGRYRPAPSLPVPR